MKQELPTGTDILAELGQIALTAMGKASLPAFQQCLRDMVNFHRVMLEIHQSDGEPPTSYALLGGMRPPHVEWRLPYRLLYRHSLEHLVTTPEMFEELSHVPLRLLTPRVAQGPAEIAAGIVSLVGMSVYFLEDWQRQRRHSAGTFEEPVLESRLGGAEAEALDNAVLTVVSSWESLASIVNRQDGATTKEPEAWALLAARWPVVAEHLRVGAELMVRAAWNGDKSSFGRFLDAFRRWNGRFNASQSWRYSLDWPELLAEGGLRDRWENFAEYLPPTEIKRVRGLPPSIAYEIVRSNTHVQVSMIAAQLMAAWWLEGRAEKFSLHAANHVLSAPEADEDDDEILAGSVNAGRVFTRLFRHAIAAQLAAAARGSHQYTAFLSAVVQRLDDFTERKIVSGRSFTPSTKNDLFDLKASLFFLLALNYDEAEADLVSKNVLSLVDDYQATRHAGEIIETASRFLITLIEMRTDHTKMDRAAKELGLSFNVEARLDRLVGYLRSMHAAIEDRRRSAITSNAVSEQVLMALSDELQGKLLHSPGSYAHLDGFSVIAVGEPGEVETYRITDVEKAFLMNPPLRQGADSYRSIVVDQMLKMITRRVWPSFAARSRSSRELGRGPTDIEFWQEAASLTSGLDRPVLLLSRGDYVAFTRSDLANDATKRSVLVRSRRLDETSPSYMTSVNGLDVFVGAVAAGRAYVTSRALLIATRYSVRADGSVVDVQFEPSTTDRARGSIIFRFQQDFVWREDHGAAILFPPAEQVSIQDESFD